MWSKLSEPLTLSINDDVEFFSEPIYGSCCSRQYVYERARTDTKKRVTKNCIVLRKGRRFAPWLIDNRQQFYSPFPLLS